MLRFIYSLFKKKVEEKEWPSKDGSAISDIDADFQRLIKLNRSGIYRRGIWKEKIKK